MSRYLLLFLLNAPFIIAAIINLLVRFKLGKITMGRFALGTAFWLLVLVCIAATKTIYEFLFSKNLTASEPLSLFDVMQITGIVVLLFVTNRLQARLEHTEKRLQDLHQELSIRLSSNERQR